MAALFYSLKYLFTRNISHFNTIPLLKIQIRHKYMKQEIYLLAFLFPTVLFFKFLNFMFLYSRLLVINFTHISVNMSIPVSQFITPPPPPPLSRLGVHTFVLYICVSISACKLVHLYHFSSFHIYALIYDIYIFSLSDLLHSVWVSRSIHVSTDDPISFLFMAE